MFVCMSIHTFLLLVLIILISQQKCEKLLFKRSATITPSWVGQAFLPCFHGLSTLCILHSAVTADNWLLSSIFNPSEAVEAKQVFYFTQTGVCTLSNLCKIKLRQRVCIIQLQTLSL